MKNFKSILVVIPCGVFNIYIFIHYNSLRFESIKIKFFLYAILKNSKLLTSLFL
ncbi:hypothetical protein BBUWI9123_F0014 (plasmid) [Borreliella burgdorferi WI91-23]|nr:hypothetical protein BBUWI9123_F0014 [Borreliella burgdorferi WI91-23]